MDISITLNGEIIARPNIGEVSNRFILMQFTGLRDKNGVEIYEGDVVRDKFGNIGTYQWGIDRWEIRISDKIYSHHYTFGDSEVIGNIHQNPSLL